MTIKTVKMPSFGADMEQGTLTQWLVAPGDRINRGDVLAVVETQKGAIELDVFDPGKVTRLLIEPGQQVPVGQAIALVELADDSTDALAEPQIEQPAGEAVVTERRAPEPGFIPASPAARNLASQHKLDLSLLTGTGPSGAIVLRDINKALASAGGGEGLRQPGRGSKARAAKTGAAKGKRAAGQGSPGGKKPARPKPKADVQGQLPAAGGFDLEAMRAAISATVSRSKREIPHYYLQHTLDISAVAQRLATENQRLETAQRQVLLAPLLCAIARTLKKYPQLNGHVDELGFNSSDSVALANAVNLRGGGLVMPVIRDADTLDAAGMMAALSGCVERAKSGALRHSDLQGASCTVSSVGERGSEVIFGVIFPPQVAIIGLGKSRQALVVEAGEAVIRQVISVSLAADHRVSDGHLGGRFLHQLDQCLQNAETLWNAPS